MIAPEPKPLHGSSLMEEHIRHLRAVGSPTRLVEALLDVALAWPDRAEGERWRRIIATADAGGRQ